MNCSCKYDSNLEFWACLRKRFLEPRLSINDCSYWVDMGSTRESEFLTRFYLYSSREWIIKVLGYFA
uniref:Putative ovule protein n=1 Tax=Solanum chacoense TaxID=4108 RepID=A0A0V0GTS8_SOLCH